MRFDKLLTLDCVTETDIYEFLETSHLSLM